MGSGIVYLLLQEVMRLNLADTNCQEWLIFCIDQSEERLSGLIRYLKSQLTKDAEKNIVSLRRAPKYAADPRLTDNSEYIGQYMEDAIGCLRLSTTLSAVRKSALIFEAVFESAATKIDLFREIEALTEVKPLYFTNTSSIPILSIDEGAGLRGRLIGFHFYNPPAVQKLVEIIPSQKTSGELKSLAVELGKRLGKKLIESKDVAGFIGNGHFIRDILHAAAQIEKLKTEVSETEAISMINGVTQDFLIRPMGIFQLIDYVGIEVCLAIMKVMAENLPGEKFDCPLLNRFLSQGIRGGQNADGTQKNGIFRYERGQIVGEYNLQTSAYEDQGISWKEKIGQKLGSLPPGHMNWKSLVGRSDRNEPLQGYFTQLQKSPTWGCRIARDYLQKSREIGETLIRSGVAASADDVNTVLTQGFFHLYGPIH
jgi:3-hydroxyacyl-CoA dehydrogenase